MNQTIDPTEQDVTWVIDALASIGRRNSLRDPIGGLLDEAGLTGTQIHAVMWLNHDGSLPMGSLAQRVGVTEKTITGIVDRLERDGYVHRERDPNDRRVVQVALADKGTEVARNLFNLMQRKIGGLLALLDTEDRADLFRLLRKLVERLDAQFAPVAVSRPSSP